MQETASSPFLCRTAEISHGGRRGSDPRSLLSLFGRTDKHDCVTVGSVGRWSDLLRARRSQLNPSALSPVLPSIPKSSLAQPAAVMPAGLIPVSVSDSRDQSWGKAGLRPPFTIESVWED
ncbi:hypothetical protein SKAU_G00402240 [Synaphobranchus kaupii]|uniref:Uncharacterized protein n=1 Tax=Synaphobranchus kaupii TaxID=118154 RepID=A0A9Q1E996_SYNKA|nr:hypothetical protein SKAU_G00402240 [Synaphobranchus kaupii]